MANIMQANRGGGRTKPVSYDNETYGVMPDPPFLTQSSPTDTQSTLNSASSETTSSPPGPTTPPRSSRSRTRYPDLGRVPLHRRGTSKTYERLEDLLKEAGYKETRVFTPEGERGESSSERNGDQKHEDNRLSGMGAVVGFLANLLPSATNSRPTSAVQIRDSSARVYSPPPSPLAHRQHPQTPSNMTSSIESLDDPTPRPTRQASAARPSTPMGSVHHQHLHRTSHQPPSQVSQVSMHQHQLLQQSQPPVHLHHTPPHQTHIAHPRPSRAGAYLRHMTSTASIPHQQRPSSTPAHSLSQVRDNDDHNALFTRKGNGEGEDEHGQPPLPTTWLESVARAVLFGGSGAHIGGPDPHHHPPTASRRTQVLRTTRSSLSQASSKHPARRSGLSDQTNIHLLPPPPLLTMIERGRAGRSEGEVTRTRVVCRSAPGSRAGSLVRGEKPRTPGKEQGRDNKRSRNDRDRLPSLARTQTEGDLWNKGRGRSDRAETASEVKNRYLSGWGVDAHSNSEGEDASDGFTHTSEEDEEDEGELDLARILVHPKRQNSIKSLRKHLASDGGGGSVAALNKSGRGVSVRGDRGAAQRNRGGSFLQRQSTAEEEDWDGQGQGDWGGGWVRRGGRSTEEDDDEAEPFAQFFGGVDAGKGSGRSGTGTSRMGLPSWGLRGGS